MMGDYGFDPLRLARNTQQLPYYREAELMNGRYAMLACAGILLTELGGLPLFTEAGEKALESSPFDLKTLVFIQVPFMAWFEYKRWDSWQRTGDISVNGYEPWDPLNYRSDRNRLAELKNGRLAMVGFLGFCSQVACRGEGPIACLRDHMSDPAHNNVYTSKVGPEVLVAVMAVNIAPFVVEAYKNLGDPEEDNWADPLPPLYSSTGKND